MLMYKITQGYGGDVYFFSAVFKRGDSCVKQIVDSLVVGTSLVSDETIHTVFSNKENTLADLHAALHKKYAKKWEPEEQQPVDAGNYEFGSAVWSDESWTYERDKGQEGHLCWKWGHGGKKEYRHFDTVRSLDEISFPVGDCVVCYDVEGLEDGVQSH